MKSFLGLLILVLATSSIQAEESAPIIFTKWIRILPGTSYYDGSFDRTITKRQKLKLYQSDSCRPMTVSIHVRKDSRSSYVPAVSRGVYWHLPEDLESANSFYLKFENPHGEQTCEIDIAAWKHSGDDIVFEAWIPIVPGESFLRDRLNRPVRSNERLFNRISEACVGMRATVSLRNSRSRAFERAIQIRGSNEWHLPRGMDVATEIEYKFDSPFTSSRDCFVYTKVEPKETPVQTEEKLVGNIRYSGGFTVARPFDIEEQRKVLGFRIDIQDVCGDAKIDRARIVDAEGKEHTVEPSSRENNSYAVSRSIPGPIKQLKITIDGSEGIQCLMPVYLTVQKN